MARKVNGFKSAEWRANVGSMARPFKNGDVDSGPRLPKGVGWMSGEGTLARRSVMLEALSSSGVISAVLIISDLRLSVAD